MKVRLEVDCSPQEARAFLGLPDVASLNDHMVQEMKKRLEGNMALVSPEELMRSWMSFGGQATEHFRKLMTAAASGAQGLKQADDRLDIRARDTAWTGRHRGLASVRPHGASGAGSLGCRRSGPEAGCCP